MEFISKNEKETKEIGKKIAKKLNGGEIVCFYGDLGAGKTTLIKGIIENLGVKKYVTSPTFTLMNLYSLPKKIKNIEKILHIDTYRINSPKELIGVGFNDYAGEKDIVTLIEWPEKISEILKDKKIQEIHLEHKKEDKRKIKVDFI